MPAEVAALPPAAADQSATVSVAAADQPGVPPPTMRLLSRRTLLSLAAGVLVVAVAVWRAGIDWAYLGDRIRHANLLLYAGAVAVFYLSFVFRAIRWRVLLRNAGERCHATTLLEIILVAFFLNCVVPAKMGDVYRGYHLRAREGVGASKALGTVVAERLIDLFVLMGLLVVAGMLTFRRRVPPSLIPYAIAGAVLCLLAATLLVLLRSGIGERLLRFLPEPLLHRFASFRAGATTALGRWGVVLPLSVAVWGCEAGRLGLVVFALGMGDLVTPSSFLLVALVAALLTTVPFTPGGVGLVEGGMVLVLVTVTSVTHQDALPIALLDRSISYASLLVVGLVVFSLGHARKPRTLTPGVQAA